MDHSDPANCSTYYDGCNCKQAIDDHMKENTRLQKIAHLLAKEIHHRQDFHVGREPITEILARAGRDVDREMAQEAAKEKPNVR